MNNKWYSLTRPAVVQFNPPRDNDEYAGSSDNAAQ